MGTFHLNNRGEDSTSTSASTITRTLDEESRDKLADIIRELRKMNLHLYSMTDEELGNEIEEDD